MGRRRALTIIVADDDSDDRMLIEDAIRESGLGNPLVMVEDGEKLLKCLRREGEFAEMMPDRCDPGLILLDLNMPKVDGLTALSQIRADPDLRRIPVVILTTSRAQEDVLRTYDTGVNSFITKPVSFEALVELMQTLNRYWIETVQLPARREA